VVVALRNGIAMGKLQICLGRWIAKRKCRKNEEKHVTVASSGEIQFVFS
jgi:hypothetical protein